MPIPVKRVDPVANSLKRVIYYLDQNDCTSFDNLKRLAEAVSLTLDISVREVLVAFHYLTKVSPEIPDFIGRYRFYGARRDLFSVIMSEEKGGKVAKKLTVVSREILSLIDSSMSKGLIQDGILRKMRAQHRVGYRLTIKALNYLLRRKILRMELRGRACLYRPYVASVLPDQAPTATPTTTTATTTITKAPITTTTTYKK